LSKIGVLNTICRGKIIGMAWGVDAVQAQWRMEQAVEGNNIVE